MLALQEGFGDDPVLEEGAALGVGGEVVGSSHSEEPGGEARVGEVEFGRFDQALGGVGEPRTDEEEEMARFQDGKPGFGGDLGDAGIGSERGDIHQLADATGAELHETLEGGEVLDVEDLPDVTLKVGANVVLKLDGGFDRAVVDWRKEPAVEEVIDGGGGLTHRLQFAEGERYGKSGARIRERVVFPDCRGPVRHRTGKPSRR